MLIVEQYNMKEEKLIEYILGFLPEEECRQVEQWYFVSEENARQLEQLYYVVRLKRTADIMDNVDTEKALMKFKAQVGKKQKRKRLRKSFHFLQRVAAVLFFPFLLLSGYMLFRQQVEAVQEIRITTSAGMVSQFSLPDGSKVWLNSGSSLVYPSRFDRSERTVYLTGQGYFEVVKEERKPFIVETVEDYAIRVYGTEFNVIAYKDEHLIETTLVTGSVELLAGGTAQFIRPGQKAVFDKESRQLLVQDVNPVLETGWKDGRIVFKNHPMDEVLKTLGRKYNVRFVVGDEDVMNSMITGKFENEQLAEVMEYLYLASGIKYKIEKPVIRNNEIVEKSVVHITR